MPAIIIYDKNGQVKLVKYCIKGRLFRNPIDGVEQPTSVKYPRDMRGYITEKMNFLTIT